MSKLTRINDSVGEAYVFYCPGCEMTHIIPVNYTAGNESRNGKKKPTWVFNGNMDKPSFKPNFMVDWIGAEPPQRCHCIIRDGEIIYLVDTTHKLCGARVKMKDDQ